MTLSQSFLITGPDQENGWLQRLAEGGCFVLAEAASNDAVPWLAERYGGDLEQTRLYWGESGRIHASVSPYCFPVDAESWPKVSEHLQTQESWGLGIQLEWFMRPQSPAEQLQVLMKHLRQWSLVSTPEDDTAILRISDWLVLSRLLAASTAAEASAIFGPVTSFTYLPTNGEAQNASLAWREPPPPLILPRQLSELQWRAILDPSLRRAHERYMAHLREYHGRWRDTDDDTLLTFVIQEQKQAVHYGFNNDRDIVRYLALATELEPAFIDTDWAQKILGEPDYLGTQSRMDRLYRKAIEQLEDA